MSSTNLSIEHLRELYDLMAEDAALWDTEGVHITLVTGFAIWPCH